jgi:hypothetical protein
LAIALITGTSTGIGLNTAVALGRSGAQLRTQGGPRRTSSQARAMQISTIIPAKVSVAHRRWPIAMIISQITIGSTTTTYVLRVSLSKPYAWSTAPRPPVVARMAIRPLAVHEPPTASASRACSGRPRRCSGGIVGPATGRTPSSSLDPLQRRLRRRRAHHSLSVPYTHGRPRCTPRSETA